MDLVFNCPNCKAELEVDASGAGEEIDCPLCKERIQIPAAEAATVAAPAAPLDAMAQAHAAAHPINAIASSAAAKIERHLKVPVHDKPQEKLVAKAAVPLEVAAKESDRQMRIKCIRHVDCVEVGHDKFDETVSKTLGQIGERNIVSLTPITFTIIDVATQKQLTDYGVMIVFRG